MSSFYGIHLLPPGNQGTITTQTQTPIFWSGPYDGDRFNFHVQLVSTAVDAGNTLNTKILRPGLIVARTSSGEKIFDIYDSTATDGYKNVPAGILAFEVGVNDMTGTAQARNAVIVRQGFVDPAKLIGFTPAVRTALSRLGFTFVDDIGSYDASAPRREVTRATDYTLVATDHGTEFNTTGAAGAVAFTLPALTEGYTAWFSNEANQNMTIARAGSDTIVTLNNLAATSVVANTTDEKIGIKFRVVAKRGKWHVYDETVRL